MSEQEKKSGGNLPGGTSVVMIESTGRQKQPYRPTELHESSPELQHKRSKAPAVPSVAEELKEATDSPENKERKESERAMSSGKPHQTVAGKLSSNTKRRESSPEEITLAPLEVETMKETVKSLPQTIPAQVSEIASADSGLEVEKRAAPEKKDDADSITEEIVELRTPEISRPTPEWRDDQEAGGLPRSESRASRVSRAMRQLFCCGATYEAPSEDEISPRSYTNGI